MTTRMHVSSRHWEALPDVDASACLALQKSLGVHRLVASLLCQRGLTEPGEAERFLKPKLTDLHDPALLPGCEAAAARVVRAVREGQPVVVYGDYDVDGITASSILWHVLRAIGGQVSTYVPHRIEEGYGLNVEALQQLAQQTPRPLVVSVDCGITAEAPAAAARAMGLELIITDHHQLDPSRLPDVDILVHPRLPGSGYPFGELCGAGVAFKLAWQVAKEFCGGERVSDDMRLLLVDLVSLAALGTVADVVPLLDENRVITRYGLAQIQRTRFVGLNALIEASRLTGERIDAYHIGFVLAPRLNACGRMGHAREAVHLLTEADGEEAKRIASFLSTENDRRRRVEQGILEQALGMIEAAGYDQPDQRAVVVASEGWHQGVIGIVASRLVDRLHRPVVMLNVENGKAHGSARSVDGVDIHAAIGQAAQWLESYGGHEMAAGMVLASEHIESLRRAVVEHVNPILSPEHLVGRLTIHGECALGDMTFELVEQLQSLAPFGRLNPWPMLRMSGVRLQRPAQRVGGEGKHLRLWLRDGSRCMSAVGFGLGDLAEELPGGSALELALTPKIGTWRGEPQIELHVKDLRLAGE